MPRLQVKYLYYVTAAHFFLKKTEENMRAGKQVNRQHTKKDWL